MFQIGPREIGADLAFGVDLALFILQCMVKFWSLFLKFRTSRKGRKPVSQLPSNSSVFALILAETSISLEEGRVSETQGKVRIPSSLDSFLLLKSLCHKDVSVLGQFCAEAIS